MGRTSKAEEAILLASSTERVRDYLIDRAKRANFWDPIEVEVEFELLARNDRLIDLTLAEYCLHAETATALFTRDPTDWPIRALVLSNTVMTTGRLLHGFPECLFGPEEALLSYLSTISPDEQDVLFRNPSLSFEFLESFLSLNRPGIVGGSNS